MVNRVLSYIVLGLLFSTNLWASEDPFEAIEHITLENGLQVFLAPSTEATLTSVRLSVGLGTEAEKGADIGVAHLLEHVLFRDKELHDEMSYLQLIREAGGSANGTTSARVTSYFGSIPSKKGLWLLQNVGKMILQPNINDNYVEKEKGTVELERGRPSPLLQTLRFNPMEYIYPKYLTKATFWKSEFGYKNESYSISEEQLSTQKLTTKQVQQFYDDYYYPSNMKLFVAGKFDRAEVLKEIHATWGSLTARSGKVLPPEPEISPRIAPYVRQEASTTPSVTIGSKILNASIADEAVINSYMEYLAHRMMKEIRNIKGQTYSAHEDSYIYKGYGYSTLQFQTPKESFDENLKIARDYIQKEARTEGLSDAQVKEAVELHLSRYHLKGKEADDMMNLAKQYNSFIEEYGAFTSPYMQLQNITPAAYNETLHKHFAPNMSYESLQRPPLFFHYDTFFIYFFSLIFSFMGFRTLLRQKFDNTKVQWVRKLQYPPLKSLEALVLAFGWYIYLHAQFLIDKVFQSELIQSHVLLSHYVYSVISVAGFLAVAQGIYSLVPRKLMVHGNDLLVKSITYYSFKISLDQIQSVEAKRPLIYPFPLSFWMSKVKHRFYHFNPLFWQKGLVIHLKDGKSYYFSVTSAEKAKDEIQGFLNKNAAFDGSSTNSDGTPKAA